MDWVKWLIPLIALAVWIISNLARNREEPRRPARPSTPAGGSGEPPNGPRSGPRRSSAEIDEFLQEVRRRREANEQRKAARKAPVKPEARRPVETPRPRPSLAMPEPVTPPAPPPPAPAAPAFITTLPRVPGAAPGVAREEVVVARVISEPAPVPAAIPATPAPALPVPVRRLGPPAAPRQILQMLRNPQSLARAIVLREILEGPLSRRPRRRLS